MGPSGMRTVLASETSVSRERSALRDDAICNVVRVAVRARSLEDPPARRRLRDLA